MPKKMKKFDLDKHVATGQFIHSAREKFTHLAVELANSYGGSKKPCLLARAVVDAIGKLKCELDSIVYAEQRDLANGDDNVPWIFHIYYPRDLNGEQVKQQLKDRKSVIE